jgi:L-ascorbate metabolism protein UlaG (beta-lactamase superfamily)
MANRYYQGPASDHFDGKRFFHPGLPPADKSLIDVLRWKLFDTRTPWPKVVPARTGLRPSAQVEGLCVTAIGHASLLIQVAGCNIVMDPVWSERASPFQRFGPFRHNPPAIAFADLPPVHQVLVTHNHYDHLDVQTIQRLWDDHRCPILSPLGNDRVIHKSAPQVEVKTGDWWESFSLPNDIRATIVPSYHWSSRGLGDRRMALWGGFVLESPVGVIYCAGDTAYRDGKIFHEVRRRFGPPALAILPIGAYEPRWFMRTQHVDPEEAVQIAVDCGARAALGIHWGTFSLTDEPYGEPEERLNAAVRSASLNATNMVALHPGDTWQPPA